MGEGHIGRFWFSSMLIVRVLEWSATRCKSGGREGGRKVGRGGVGMYPGVSRCEPLLLLPAALYCSAEAEKGFYLCFQR